MKTETQWGETPTFQWGEAPRKSKFPVGLSPTTRRGEKPHYFLYLGYQSTELHSHFAAMSHMILT